MHLSKQDLNTEKIPSAQRGDMDQQQSRVKHFQKLGYSYSDIQRVLHSLQHDAQNNDILEELIKTCRTTGAYHMGAERAPGSSPQLVPRGCSSPQQHADTQGGPQQHGIPDVPASSCFRPVVIDGSNVAISHGNKQVFSCQGIQLAVQWFWDRGIRDITVFVPSWRKEQSRPKAPITDQHILSELERKNILVYTPSRCIKGKRVVCYYGCYIVKLAYDSDGIIVSNDDYHDLQEEKPQWKKFIEDRLLMYTFANDTFMPPDDPLGRNGPTIENFLRKKPAGSASKQQHCPYGRKCTYGVKCKFYHPERSKQPQLSVADELRAKSQPASDTEEFLHLSHERFSNTSPRYTTTTNENPQHTTSKNAATLFSASQEEVAYLQGDLYLSYSAEDITKRPAYLQRSLPALSNESNQACGSLEVSMSRLHLSDSALQTSLACSSGCGSDSSYYLSDSWNTGHRRARGPEWACGYSPGTATLSHCQHTHSDLSLSCTHTPHPFQRCKPQCPYSRLMSSPYEEPPLYHGSSTHHTNYSRLPEVSWGQVQAMDREGRDQTTDRRKEVRSKLSTIFPQNIVDQVMNLYPHTLDTTELIALIIKYRNSQLL